MKKFEFELEKINEADLDIKVNVRWDGIPYSYSEEKIRVYNIKIVHKPTGLIASADSNTTIDMGYKYALNELEKKYTKLVLKKKLQIRDNYMNNEELTMDFIRDISSSIYEKEIFFYDKELDKWYSRKDCDYISFEEVLDILKEDILSLINNVGGKYE